MPVPEYFGSFHSEEGEEIVERTDLMKNHVENIFRSEYLLHFRWQNIVNALKFLTANIR